MSTLLYIQASPRGDLSHSITVADAFVTSYKSLHSKDEIITLNLFSKTLPAFDGDILKAKYSILNGLKHTAAEQAAWQAVVSIIEEFKSADKYILAVPMWNFHLPYILKQYIDILVQPSYTFSYSEEEGYKGLVTGKPILLVMARGGQYPPGSMGEAYDFQSRYLEHILGFIGFTDIQKLVIEPTLSGGPETAQKRRNAAIAAAKELGLRF